MGREMSSGYVYAVVWLITHVDRRACIRTVDVRRALDKGTKLDGPITIAIPEEADPLLCRQEMVLSRVGTPTTRLDGHFTRAKHGYDGPGAARAW